MYFFVGKKKESVTRILESFNFSPVIGIKVLMEKSLIMDSQGQIQNLLVWSWKIVESYSFGKALRFIHRRIIYYFSDIHITMEQLKNLKHLSLRGCKNALGLQIWSSLIFSSLLEKGNNSMGLFFPNLSGLCSLTKLDISDCNILDRGILSNLGFLPSLEK